MRHHSKKKILCVHQFNTCALTIHTILQLKFSEIHFFFNKKQQQQQLPVEIKNRRLSSFNCVPILIFFQVLNSKRLHVLPYIFFPPCWNKRRLLTDFICAIYIKHPEKIPVFAIDFVFFLHTMNTLSQ